MGTKWGTSRPIDDIYHSEHTYDRYLQFVLRKLRGVVTSPSAVLPLSHEKGDLLFSGALHAVRGSDMTIQPSFSTLVLFVGPSLPSSLSHNT